MASTTQASKDSRTSFGMAYLAAAAKRVPGLRASASLLIADGLFAIGFAAGLAGALSRIAAGAPASAIAWLALALACAALRGAGGLLAARVGARCAGLVKLGLRRRVVAAALGRSGGVRASDDVGGTLLSLAVDEVEAVDGYVARFLPARRAATVTPLVVLAVVAVASPICAALTFVPFVVLMALAGMASAAQSQRQFAALARLSGLFVDRLRALPVVLAFRAEGRETRRLADASLEVAERTVQVLRAAFLSSAVLEFFSALCVALVAVYAGFNLLGLLPFHVPEKLDLGRAFFVLALAPEFYAPMRRLAAAYHDRSAAQAAAERLHAFEQPDGAASPVAVVALSGSRSLHAPTVRFENVTVRYAEDASDVVSHLSFSLRAGQTLAILGPSGSGKTTLLRLLLGMAPLSSGRVWIDSAPLDEHRGIAARAAWIGQAPLMTQGSLRSNLLLAAPDASPQELLDAIERVGLGPTIARRPGGLDARIDERGSGLSGGERRRIALARALLKPSSVWLLDEPTTHLDDASELALIATIARVRAGRTLLIATHSERLAALADVVIRLGESQ
jgi:ATP-binding cassette subfamily C protein CydD